MDELSKNIGYFINHLPYKEICSRDIRETFDQFDAKKLNNELLDTIK